MRLDSDVHAVLTALSVVVAVAASYLAVASPGGYLLLAVLSPEGDLGPYPEYLYAGQELRLQVVVANGFREPMLARIEASVYCGEPVEWRPVWEKTVMVGAGGNASVLFEYPIEAPCDREYIVFRLFKYNGSGWEYTGREAYVSFPVKALGGS